MGSWTQKIQIPIPNSNAASWVIFGQSLFLSLSQPQWVVKRTKGRNSAHYPELLGGRVVSKCENKK